MLDYLYLARVGIQYVTHVQIKHGLYRAHLNLRLSPYQILICGLSENHIFYTNIEPYIFYMHPTLESDMLQILKTQMG